MMTYSGGLEKTVFSSQLSLLKNDGYIMFCGENKNFITIPNTEAAKQAKISMKSSFISTEKAFIYWIYSLALPIKLLYSTDQVSVKRGDVWANSITA